eukprot:TRINITY_DN6766_c0_g1_i1.p1 TRINITY_DN6766_c0_g1~~TRINITY_DN6766_c0_g1_i1.p1  ORF type:complete len:545 (+),score=99.73 TRINITY_DN6766_c0_g1_i1:233-1867(+)
MNSSSSSQFMDKQIMGLSGSQNSEIFDLLNAQEEHNGGKKDEILPSYDFQPIRHSQPTILEGSNAVAGARVWNSADSKSNSASIRNYASLEPNESSKVTQEKERGTNDTAMMSEIDRTMKKHTDNLLHALEGVSARFSQLESRTRDLENSVDDLKVTIGNNHGSTDGRLRQLENILRELQIGVQVLRDKQEITEAQLQLAKLQVSQGGDHQPTENQTPALQTDSLQQTMPPPEQSLHQSLPTPVVLPQPPPVPTPLPPNAPLPPPPQQNPPTQLPPQLSQNQIPSIPSLPREFYFPPPGQPPEPMHQQYQLPPQQQQPPQPQHYQAPPQLPQYSQPPQPANPPQLQPSLTHQPEETSYTPPSQTYPPRQPASLTQPPSGPPPSLFYGSTAQMYEPSSRPSSGQLPFSSGYNAQLSGPNFNDPYSFSGPPSQYGSSVMKPPQVQSPSAPSGGNSNYPRLPTAQILPHALPAASSVSGGSGSGGTGNRVPIDDVVDMVTTMGFSREQVRATVRKLTENGQSVDLNVVLDKLMNDGEVQPQKGWFGR